MIIFTFIQTPQVAIAGTATILAGLGLYFLVRPKDAIPHNNVKNNVNR